MTGDARSMMCDGQRPSRGRTQRQWKRYRSTQTLVKTITQFYSLRLFFFLKHITDLGCLWFQLSSLLISCLILWCWQSHLQFRRHLREKELHFQAPRHCLHMQMMETFRINQMFPNLYHRNIVTYLNGSGWLCRISVELNLSSLQTGIHPRDQHIHIHRQLTYNN